MTKKLKYILKIKLIMILTAALVNMSKNEVDVNIDYSLGCDVDRSVISEICGGNDIRQWC